MDDFPRPISILMPYRPSDAGVWLPALTPSKASFSMTPLRCHLNAKRTVAGVSLGPHLEGAALPHPDISDAYGAQLGCRKRFGVRMPKFNHKLVRRLERYAVKWLTKNITKFDACHQFDLEKWLSGTNYPEARKQELRDLWKGSLEMVSRRTKRAKSFIKDEYYPEWKYPRAINSRDDLFKTFFGPVVKEIESRLYENHHFIKHVPVADRPQYIQDHLYKVGAKTFGTDFTAFESSFVEYISVRLEYRLYKYMLEGHPMWFLIEEVLLTVKFGIQTIVFKYFNVYIIATRLSGEMDTSSSNGFSNLMINSFLLEEVCHVEWFDGVVEGDDGLFSFIGNSGPKPSMYKDLGFNIKIQYFRELYEASFCGIVFDPATFVNVACPYKNLAKFGWTTHTYLKANPLTRLKLLRAKSLSLAYQYPGCPVLQELAEYGMRVTKHVNLGKFVDQSEGWWEREMAKLITNNGLPLLRKVEMSTRLLMERQFGMSVSEQIAIESYLRSKTDLTPIKIDLSSFPDLWVRNYYTYGVSYDDIDTFTRPAVNSFNCGFEDKIVSQQGNRGSKTVPVGYVDHNGTRYYDCMYKRFKDPPFVPSYIVDP